MSQQFEKLLARLALPQVEADVFVGGSGVGGVGAENRLYGGLVAAQAAVAAARTVESLPMHSLHAYFLRPGRPEQPIELRVTRTKTGRNFHSRLVLGSQGDDLIFQLLASFSANRGGPSHADPMPSAPAPTDLPNRDQARGRPGWQNMTIDVRLCDPLTATSPLPPSKRVWIKPAGRVPDDPVTQLGVLVFATDRAFLSTAWRPHAAHGTLHGASLDHALWFHDDVRFDDWLLYDMHSPVAANGRGLVWGGLYDPQRGRVASASQEGTLTHRPHD